MCAHCFQGEERHYNEHGDQDRNQGVFNRAHRVHRSGTELGRSKACPL